MGNGKHPARTLSTGAETPKEGYYVGHLLREGALGVGSADHGGGQTSGDWTWLWGVGSGQNCAAEGCPEGEAGGRRVRDTSGSCHHKPGQESIVYGSDTLQVLSQWQMENKVAEFLRTYS